MVDLTITVCVKFPPDDLAILDALEQFERLKRSDIVRRAVRAYAAQQGPKSKRPKPMLGDKSRSRWGLLPTAGAVTRQEPALNSSSPQFEYPRPCPRRDRSSLCQRCPEAGGFGPAKQCHGASSATGKMRPIQPMMQ